MIASGITCDIGKVVYVRMNKPLFILLYTFHPAVLVCRHGQRLEVVPSYYVLRVHKLHTTREFLASLNGHIPHSLAVEA